jgi:hypothetical protein
MDDDGLPNTMNGAFPPNSKDNFLRVDADAADSHFPVAVDPVNEIFRILGLLVNFCPTCGVASLDTGSTEKTFSGIPALIPRFISAIAVKGVSGAGFTMHEHPAANAGATFRVIMAAGKFQGVIIAATPTGCFRVYICIDDFEDGRTSEWI